MIIVALGTIALAGGYIPELQYGINPIMENGTAPKWAVIVIFVAVIYFCFRPRQTRR